MCCHVEASVICKENCYSERGAQTCLAYLKVEMKKKKKKLQFWLAADGYYHGMHPQ
jgi:hypothetical protein